MRAIPVMHPRRRPRQARAQATVDAIIQATARVLIEDGYDRASTNRIAQAAGVSIGSLYQYFPSKEALVAALVEEHFDLSGLAGFFCNGEIGPVGEKNFLHSHTAALALFVKK